MTEQMTQWEPIKLRKGTFGDRVVQGNQFRDENGRTAWHITTWTDLASKFDDYWFQGSDFFEMLRMDYAVNLRAENHFTTGGKIIEMDATKESNIRKAIEEWDREGSNSNSI
jgi:hypothetical protein